MAIDETKYRNRLIEKKLEDYLSVFGAVSIEVNAGSAIYT